MRFIATVAFKGLRVKLTFPISGHFDVLESTVGCDQITRVGAVAIAFAFETAFSLSGSNEGIEFLAHHEFQNRPHGALSQSTQMLVKFLLIGHRGSWLLLG